MPLPLSSTIRRTVSASTSSVCSDMCGGTPALSQASNALSINSLITTSPKRARLMPVIFWSSVTSKYSDTRVGDHRTDEGRAFLRERSPLTYVDRIKKPLLIAQGANDPRVNQAEAEQIVQAMQERGLPVTYLLYPDEGHGFSSVSNARSFNAVAEAFLSECLGGRYEPFGKAFESSSITVPVGAEHIPGLG